MQKKSMLVGPEKIIVVLLKRTAFFSFLAVGHVGVILSTWRLHRTSTKYDKDINAWGTCFIHGVLVVHGEC